jgi:hypothetical protein
VKAVVGAHLALPWVAMKHPWSFDEFKLPVHPNFSISKGNGGKRWARSASKWEGITKAGLD